MAEDTCATEIQPTTRTVGFETDPRLPPGTIITHESEGRLLQVQVLRSSFEYDGQVSRSMLDQQRDTRVTARPTARQDEAPVTSPGVGGPWGYRAARTGAGAEPDLTGGAPRGPATVAGRGVDFLCCGRRWEAAPCCYGGRSGPPGCW
jgi:hypothetical protein